MRQLKLQSKQEVKVRGIDFEERRSRVELVLDRLFDGKQRRMAQAIQMSQTVLSVVLSRKQRAGDQLLEAIGRLPAVNPTWAKTGTGEPLLNTPERPKESSIPVCDVLIPGSPQQHRQFLTGGAYPVPPEMWGDDRYFFRLPTHERLLNDSRLGFLPKDLLLIETSTDWLSRRDLVRQRICVIAAQSKVGQRLELDLVRENEEEILMGERLGMVHLPTHATSSITASGHQRPTTRRRRNIKLPGAESSVKSSAPSREPPSGQRIVGVAIMLCRPDLEVAF